MVCVSCILGGFGVPELILGILFAVWSLFTRFFSKAEPLKTVSVNLPRAEHAAPLSAADAPRGADAATAAIREQAAEAAPSS